MNHPFPLPPAADSPDTQDGGSGRDWQPLCTQASGGRGGRGAAYRRDGDDVGAYEAR